MRTKSYDMKKILAMLCILVVNNLIARDFDPKDTWAYLYEDFTPGKVYNSKGDIILEGKVNVSVLDGKLHYVKGDKIMEADMLQVYSVTITETKEDRYSSTTQEDFYMNVGEKMMRVVSRSDKSAVLESVEVDMDKLSKAEIGYGITSSSASVQGVHMAAMSSLVSTTYIDANEKKGSGERIPIKEYTYLLTRGTLVIAKKREVVKLPGLDRKAAEAFFKEEKIKWNSAEDLQKVADYISDNR